VVKESDEDETPNKCAVLEPIQIDEYAWTDMVGFCDAASSEVSGLFLWHRDDNTNKIKIVRFIFLKQRCSGAATDFDGPFYARLMRRLRPWFARGYRVGWFHTHYNFSPFWSGTDRDTRSQMSLGTDFFLSIVTAQPDKTDKKRYYLCAIDANEPIKFSADSVTLDFIPNERKSNKDYAGIIRRYVDSPPPFVFSSFEGTEFLGWLKDEDLDKPWNYEKGRPMFWWEIDDMNEKEKIYGRETY